MTKLRLVAKILSVLAMSWPLSTAHAADGTWVANSGGDWSDPNNWSGGIIADGADSTASFTSNAIDTRTVTLNTDRTIGHLTFSDNGSSGARSVLSGVSTLTLDVTNDSPKITTTTNAEISTVVAGNLGFTKLGNLGLSLMGANTYGGTTTISRGPLLAVDGVGLPSSTNLNFDGGMYQASGVFSRTLGAGAGQVQWAGDGGFLNLNALAPLTIRLNGNANAVRWGSEGFVPNDKKLFLEGAIDFQNDIDLAGGTRTFEIGGALAPQIGGAIANGNLMISDGGATPLILTGTNTYADTMFGDFSAKLQIGNGGTTGTLGTGTVALGAYGELVFNRSNEILVDNTITSSFSSGGLVQAGSGTTILTGDLSGFGGRVSALGGTLVLDYSSFGSSKIGEINSLGISDAKLELAGGTHQEIVGSTRISGQASISRSSGAATLRLKAIRFNLSGSLDISEDNLADTFNLNVNGALAGITVGGKLAKNAVNTGNGMIVALTDADYVNAPRLGGQLPDGLANIRVVNGGTSGPVTLHAPGTTSINTITQSATEGDVEIDVGDGNTLRMGPYGTILVPSGANALNITGGTLTAGGANNTEGTIAVHNSADVTISSVITNNGSGRVSLEKFNSGRLVLTGSSSYTGVTFVSGGTLQVGDGGTSGSIPGNAFLFINGSLTFNRSDDVTFAGEVSGPGTLVQDGPGTLTLTATNEHERTTVDAGRLVVNGRIRGDGSTVVNSGASLGGTGSIFGDVTIKSGGHLAPGSIGQRLTVDSLTLSTGSVLDFKLNRNGPTVAADQVEVLATDGLTIDGATLNLTNAGSMTPGTYTLIRYSGILNGSISNINLGTTPAGFSYILGQSTVNTIYVVVSHNGDFDRNGIVDAADYVVWRKGRGTDFTLNDYSIWRRNYGQSFASGAETTLNPVPEPSTACFFVVAACVATIWKTSIGRRFFAGSWIEHDIALTNIASTDTNEP
jgi:autotransporter-associated beta strand protein